MRCGVWAGVAWPCEEVGKKGTGCVCEGVRAARKHWARPGEGVGAGTPPLPPSPPLPSSSQAYRGRPLKLETIFQTIFPALFLDEEGKPVTTDRAMSGRTEEEDLALLDELGLGE